MIASRALVVVVTWLVFSHSATEVNIAAPYGSCSGSILNAWLDVFFLVDSSAGMTQNGLKNVEAFIKTAMRQMTIGEDEFGQSRVGIVTYASKALVERDFNDTGILSKPLTFSDGDKNSNLLDAIYAAQSMFNAFPSSSHHHQVIVIATSTYKSGGLNDPTQAAAQFVEDGGDIVTIDYHNKDVGLSPLSTLATHNLAFTNDDQEVTNLFHSLLNVNCFCGDNLFTVGESAHGAPVSGCVGAEMFQSDWTSAAEMCSRDNSYLIKVEDEKEHEGLNALIKKPFWIGLKFDQTRGKFYWPDWTELGDFKAFAAFEEQRPNGDCVYNRDSEWYSAPCEGDADGQTDLIYYCESLPCSPGKDCFDVSSTPQVFTAPLVDEGDQTESTSTMKTTKTTMTTKTTTTATDETTTSTTLDDDETEDNTTKMTRRTRKPGPP